MVRPMLRVENVVRMRMPHDEMESWKQVSCTLEPGNTVHDVLPRKQSMINDNSINSTHEADR
jgi:hypothetical protein